MCDGTSPFFWLPHSWPPHYPSPSRGYGEAEVAAGGPPGGRPFRGAAAAGTGEGP